jgi:hypothetical protein
MDGQTWITSTVARLAHGALAEAWKQMQGSATVPVTRNGEAIW